MSDLIDVVSMSYRGRSVFSKSPMSLKVGLGECLLGVGLGLAQAGKRVQWLLPLHMKRLKLEIKDGIQHDSGCRYSER